jgi:FkbM family methyltransferase
MRFGRVDKVPTLRKARKIMLSIVGRDHSAVRYCFAYGFEILFPAWDTHMVIAASNARIPHPRLTGVFHALIQPGDTFVDVGANAGFYSLLAATAMGNSGRVISFEPDPRNLPLLRSNARINGFEHLIQIEPKALSDRECELDFWSAPENTWGGGLVKLPDSESLHCRVSATTLDKYMATTSSDQVDLIKIDIEGAEPLALKGMREALRTAKVVIYEINKPRLDQLKIRPLDLIRQTNEQGGFDTTLLTDERTDEILSLENSRSTEILETYGWANVMSAKGDAVKRIHELVGI